MYWDEFKKLAFKEIYVQSSSGNIAFAKVIENNYGISLETLTGQDITKLNYSKKMKTVENRQNTININWDIATYGKH